MLVSLPELAPMVYIAAPFFNPNQIDLVRIIEGICSANRLQFYSPRLHSGSHLLTPEERRNNASWKPILKSNITELHRCDLVVAVVEYRMPKNHKLAVYNTETRVVTKAELELELPDAGVIFECGYAYATGKTIVGFHSQKSVSSLNLMLSHTIAGFVTGFTDLSDFLVWKNNSWDWSVATRFTGEVE